MKHEEISDRLSVYLENELGQEEKDEVKRHLARCGVCRESLTDLEWTVDQLKVLPEVDPPPGFAARIMAQLQEAPPAVIEQRGRVVSPARIIISLVAGAVIVLAVIGYYLVQRGIREVQSTVPSPPSPTGGVRPVAPPAEAGRGAGSQTASPAVSPRSATVPSGRSTSPSPPSIEVPNPQPMLPTESAPPAPAHSVKRQAAPELPASGDGFRMEGELGAPPPHRKKGGAGEALPSGE